MDENKESLSNLQTALSMELSAVTQYLLHAHVLDDWGLDRLADTMREEMHEELDHAGRFIDRILYLGGAPVMEPQKSARPSKDLKEMFEADRKDEKDSIAFYTKAARSAYDSDDIGSRALFEDILLDEEGHWDWLDQQLRLLDRMGEPTYMARHMSGKAENES